MLVVWVFESVLLFDSWVFFFSNTLVFHREKKGVERKKSVAFGLGTHLERVSLDTALLRLSQLTDLWFDPVPPVLWVQAPVWPAGILLVSAGSSSVPLSGPFRPFIWALQRLRILANTETAETDGFSATRDVGRRAPSTAVKVAHERVAKSGECCGSVTCYIGQGPSCGNRIGTDLCQINLNGQQNRLFPRFSVHYKDVRRARISPYVLLPYLSSG